MPVSDILARIGGILLCLSGLWNGFMSTIWFLSLVWVCVGAFWLIPMLMAFTTFILGVAAMAMGHQKWLIAAPIMSCVASLFNFNFIGVMLDLTALGLMVGSMVLRNQEDAAGMEMH